MLNPNSERRLLPDDTIFSQLVQCAIEFDGPAFRDPDYEVIADHRQLIHDVLQMSERIYDTIPPLSFDNSGLLREENMFILLLAPNGYEFVVGCLAILSVGGAVVPLGTLRAKRIYLE
jgi:malonyl-CoA/methylmalonyl-CoA synthetase